ncbi:MAG: sigma-70 family RNA polymerase sigma factor [Cyanobacteria bacterium J06638_7]
MASESADRWIDAASRYPLLTAEQELHLGRQIREWLDHPDGRDDCPSAIRKRGIRARNRVVQCNLRLVATLALRKRLGPHTLLEDLLQCGALGLQRAAEKFDPARGYKFSTYAFWWIRQAMQRAAETDRPVRLPADGIRTALSGTTARAEQIRQLIDPSRLDLPAAGCSTPLALSLTGSELTVESVAWGEALREVQQELPADDLALVELVAEGAGTEAEMVSLCGLGRNEYRAKLKAARASVRCLPAVAAVLAA